MYDYCNPKDCSPQAGSSIRGISQVRILEWVAISFSRGLPDPGIKPRSPALQADSLTEPPRILLCVVLHSLLLKSWMTYVNLKGFTSKPSWVDMSWVSPLRDHASLTRKMCGFIAPLEQLWKWVCDIPLTEWKFRHIQNGPAGQFCPCIFLELVPWGCLVTWENGLGLNL